MKQSYPYHVIKQGDDIYRYMFCDYEAYTGYYTYNVQKRVLWLFWKTVFIAEELSEAECIRKCEEYIHTVGDNEGPSLIPCH